MCMHTFDAVVLDEELGSDVDLGEQERGHREQRLVAPALFDRQVDRTLALGARAVLRVELRPRRRTCVRNRPYANILLL